MEAAVYKAVERRGYPGRLRDRMMMTSDDTTRHALRKRAYDLKTAMHALADELRELHPEAAASAHKGRLAAFEVWTYLATPIEDEDDH